jgi:uncharacterized membrane protein
MRYASWLFGIASALAGLCDLIWGQFEPAHQPIQAWSDHIPAVAILARIVALWLILGGLALLIRSAARTGAAALAILYAIFSFFPLPRLITAPHFLGHQPGVYIGVLITVAQQIILFVAAGTLWLSLGARSSPRYPATHAVRWLFGLCCIEFALGHFVTAQATGSMVPSWIPLSGAFWTILTGIAFLLAGLGIITRIHDVLAARLLAVMLLIFSVVVLAPRVFAHPHDLVTWGSSAYNLTAVAAAWILSAWLAAPRELATSGVPRSASVEVRTQP